MMQGVASVGIQVTNYSIAAAFYSDRKEIIIGMLEGATGVGMMLGPLIGTGLFELGGYNFMLYSFGAFFVSLAIFLPRLLPEKLDLYTDQEKD